VRSVEEQEGAHSHRHMGVCIGPDGRALPEADCPACFCDSAACPNCGGASAGSVLSAEARRSGSIEGEDHALQKWTRSEERRSSGPTHDGAKVVGLGILHAGNDFCNGSIAPISHVTNACLIDCLHADDVEAILSDKSVGLARRPPGK
jgi:hypothetical protein